MNEALKRTYRELTCSDEEMGGEAYLDLEDQLTPFAGGVRYNVMPPSKRFRDMSLLSGGEKTLAALALVFAGQEYQKPPFIVLDEVDAPLDCYNVRSVRRFLSKAHFQSLVSSLKEEFFCQADALFGVCKDRATDSSCVYGVAMQELATN